MLTNANIIAIVSISIIVLLNLGGWIYFIGRMTSRLENLELALKNGVTKQIANIDKRTQQHSLDIASIMATCKARQEARAEC